VSTKTELGVWGFEHYVFYLCALIEKLHPTKPDGDLAIALAGARLAARGGPKRLDDLRLPENSFSKRWNAIEQIANLLLDVCAEWADIEERTDDDLDVTIVTASKDFTRQLHESLDHEAYANATTYVRDAERIALPYLDYTGLAECAASVFMPRDADRRDAAVAAMSVGHYDVALDILTRREEE
jgi:hypothetical protein